MIRMGQVIGFRHYELGFHSTATLGVFGATAAVARLFRCDPNTTANAFAIAASLASGLQLNFGSMVKPLHVGIAAANAIRAIAWAKAGIEASRGDLFAPGGMLDAFTGGAQVEWPDADGLGNPFTIQAPGFDRKRYPCCYLLHKIIALGLEARREGIRLKDVARFRVVMPNGGTRPLIHPCPGSGSEAQFSGPYALLASINDGDINLSSFTDAAVDRKFLRARYQDVAIVEVGNTSLNAEEIGAATVTLELMLTDGSSRIYARDAAPGSSGDPMTSSELRAKWIDCFQHVRPDLPTDEAAAFHDNGVAVLASGPIGSWLYSVWRELGVADTQQDRTKATCTDEAH
jgi:2-methylcitrate dehydratase PrpD